MNLKPTWQTISTITAIVIAITTGIWKVAPVLVKMDELYQNADVLLKQKEVLEDLKLHNDDLRSLHGEFHQFQDSTRIYMDVIMSGKFPYDSIIVYTHSGWKKFQKDDPKILKYFK